MIKFLHAADLHLDSPFRSLPPEKAAALRQTQLQVVTELVELCDQEQCDLLLLSGDLFDAASARGDVPQALMRILRGCRARVFIAPGNHDFFAPGSPYAGPWPENVHIFKTTEPSSVVVEALNAEIWGAAFTGPAAQGMLEGFHIRDPQLLNLMVLHGDTESADSRYDPITRQQLEDSGLDYLALGHIHCASGLRQAGKTCYAWPGCAMGRGFDESGPRGVYLGCLTEQGCTLEFRTLSGIRYEILTVESGDDPLAAIQAAAPADAQRCIVRVILTGPSDPVDTRRLQEALADRFFSLTVRDQTTPRRDLWAESGEETLKGLFLERLRTAPARQEDPQLYELAAALGVGAMEGWEVPDLCS